MRTSLPKMSKTLLATCHIKEEEAFICLQIPVCFEVRAIAKGQPRYGAPGAKKVKGLAQAHDSGSLWLGAGA